MGSQISIEHHLPEVTPLRVIFSLSASLSLSASPSMFSLSILLCVSLPLPRFLCLFCFLSLLMDLLAFLLVPVSLALSRMGWTFRLVMGHGVSHQRATTLGTVAGWGWSSNTGCRRAAAGPMQHPRLSQQRAFKRDATAPFSCDAPAGAAHWQPAHCSLTPYRAAHSPQQQRQQQKTLLVRRPQHQSLPQVGGGGPL